MKRVWFSIERTAAWLLLPLLLLQFLSGYAMLHWRLFSGILSRPTAFRIHSIIQPITVAAFVIHGSQRVRRALARRGIKGRWLDTGLAFLGAGLVSFSVYLYLQG
jgi:hypothetical protein